MNTRLRSRDESNKYLILVPLLVLIIGLILTYLHPILSTGFFGIVLSLTGALACFVFGMLFTDLWTTSRRASKLSQEREGRSLVEESQEIFYDPFENPDDLEENES
jgi:L-asparagine transporter-like permease